MEERMGSMIRIATDGMKGRLFRDFAGGAFFCFYDQLGILEA
jgi:hypothetical protein